MFNAILLVIVSKNYEKEVLSKDAKSDINIMQAIFFCNISLQKKTKNRRANVKNKEQELNMAMD